MNREEFMQALERELYDVPSEEKEAALQYYNDYFEDAGAENEQEVLESLGAPEKLAESIRGGMDGKENEGEFTENGFSTGESKDFLTKISKTDQSAWQEEAGQNDRQAQEMQKVPVKKERNVWKWIAIILICILVGPVCIPIVIAIISVVFALLLVIGAIIAALAAVGVALFAGGITVALVGISELLKIPAGGAVLIGAGMVLMAVGILVTVFFAWVFFKLSVLLFKTLVELCRKPFHKKGKEETAK